MKLVFSANKLMLCSSLVGIFRNTEKLCRNFPCHARQYVEFDSERKLRVKKNK